MGRFVPSAAPPPRCGSAGTEILMPNERWFLCPGQVPVPCRLRLRVLAGGYVAQIGENVIPVVQGQSSRVAAGHVGPSWARFPCPPPEPPPPLVHPPPHSPAGAPAPPAPP